MTNEELNLFKRYLKERGIYAEFFRASGKCPERRFGMSIRKFLAQKTTPGEEIMDLIGWAEAKWKGWGEEYTKYRGFLKKMESNKKILNKNKDNFYEFFQEIKKINQ